MSVNDFNSESLSLRLEDLNVTLYQIAKKYAILKGEPNASATRYHSSIGKAIENPAASKLETIMLIVETLGGTLKVEWDEQTSLNDYQQFALDSRISTLEDDMKDIKILLLNISQSLNKD